jgi:hypothetical protein
LTTVLIFLCFSFPIKDCTNNNAFLIEFWWWCVSRCKSLRVVSAA